MSRKARGFMYLGYGRLRNPSGRVLTPVDKTLALAGMGYLAPNTTYMLYPNYSDRTAGNRHYLYIPGVGWTDRCPLTAGSMANTGEITGGSQTISVTGTVESFSVIWNNSGLPVVAFSIGFNRSLTSAERTALSSTAFWALILPAAINTANCTALYPWLAPNYQNLVLLIEADKITALSNNDPCGSWADLSGLGNTVVQTGAASIKPTYKTNILNSLPGIYFDGSDYLLNHAIAAYFTGEDKPGSCVAVAKRDVDNTYHYAISCGPNISGGLARYHLLAYQNSDACRPERKDNAGNSATNAATIGVSTNAHILSVVHAAKTTSVWANGVNKVNAGAADVGAQTLDLFNIGAWPVYTSRQSYFTGYLHAAAIYRAALSDADRALIEARFASVWGITLP